MEATMMKKCVKCGRELPIEDFSRNAASKDGHQSACKECLRVYNREYAKRRKAKKIENQMIEFEKKHKIYTNIELAKFTPRELMSELKARGYEGVLKYREVKVTEHIIDFSKLGE
jgi:hypothetical protein